MALPGSRLNIHEHLPADPLTRKERVISKRKEVGYGRYTFVANTVNVLDCMEVHCPLVQARPR